MSYILVRDGEPPFVPGIRKRLAALLQEHADRRHLLG